jgi:hypothetical protein
LLLLRERAKSSRLWRKVKIAAGIAKAMSRTNFGLTTPPEEIAAVRSKNEFFEVPFINLFSPAAVPLSKKIVSIYKCTKTPF